MPVISSHQAASGAAFIAGIRCDTAILPDPTADIVVPGGTIGKDAAARVAQFTEERRIPATHPAVEETVSVPPPALAAPSKAAKPAATRSAKPAAIKPAAKKPLARRTVKKIAAKKSSAKKSAAKRAVKATKQ